VKVISTSRNVRWGVLIYACGNNDLEPEITHAVLSLFANSRFEDASIAVQLGRASRELIAVLRPGLKYHFRGGEWRGVKRFFREAGCHNGKFSGLIDPVEDLGNQNLACPKSLSDFLIWAIKAVAAEQYLVILSGHGAAFIGSMVDFSHGRPQIMGVPQMSKAMHKALNDTGKSISYLLMDACSMNLVENIYELARYKAAKIFLGSSGFIPLEGYDYSLWVKKLCGQNFIPGKKIMAVNSELLSGIEAAALDKYRLTLLKQQLSGLAERLIRLGISPAVFNRSGEALISLAELLNKVLVNFSTDSVLIKIAGAALKLLADIDLTNSGMKIFCPGRQEVFNHYAGYYQKLSFSSNNFWPLWLSGGKPLLHGSPMDDPFSSIYLPLDILTEHILNLNTGMTVAEVEEIYRKLGWKQRENRSQDGYLTNS